MRAVKITIVFILRYFSQFRLPSSILKLFIVTNTSLQLLNWTRIQVFGIKTPSIWSVFEIKIIKTFVWMRKTFWKKANRKRMKFSKSSRAVISVYFELLNQSWGEYMKRKSVLICRIVLKKRNAWTFWGNEWEQGLSYLPFFLRRNRMHTKHLKYIYYLLSC